MKMIAIGDNVTDCYMDEELYYPGGNAVNVAVGCSRTGYFSEVAYLGIFGDDENAAHLQNSLIKEKVKLDRCRRAYARTAMPKVCLKDGDRVFMAGPRDSVAHLYRLRLINEDLEYIKQFDICHTSCFSSIEQELPQLQKCLDVSFDFSEMTDEAYLSKVCPFIKYAFFSGSELSDSEINKLIERCHELGTSIVGVTLGSRGSIFSRNGERFIKTITPIKAIDTMGAGDSFISGFLSEYTKSEDMEAALNFAAQCSAKTCLCHGGFGYPHPFGKNMFD